MLFVNDNLFFYSFHIINCTFDSPWLATKWSTWSTHQKNIDTVPLCYEVVKPVINGSYSSEDEFERLVQSTTVGFASWALPEAYFKSKMQHAFLNSLWMESRLEMPQNGPKRLKPQYLHFFHGTLCLLWGDSLFRWRNHIHLLLGTEKKRGAKNWVDGSDESAATLLVEF